MPAIAITLTPEDYGSCKMTPKGTSSITLKRPEPDGEWTAPANPPKTFEGRPVDGSNDITLTQPWAEFQIDIRVNLLDALVTALQGLFASLTTLIAGEINKGVSDAAQRIRDLIGDKFRELQITWECRFDIQSNTTLLVKHTHDYNIQITKTNVSTTDRMKWLIDTRLRVAGQNAQAARIQKNGAKTEVESITRHDLVTVPPGEHVVESISRIRLDCDGFLKDIEAMLKELTNAITEGLDLQQTVAKYMVDWIKSNTSFWGGPSKSDTDAERQRKTTELETRIKTDIKKFAETLYKRLIELLQEYRGKVALDKSLVELVCLSEAGVKRISRLMHQAEKGQIDKQTDNTLKTRTQLLRTSEFGMLVPGRQLIAGDTWDAMGLVAEDYYFAILPAAVVERPLAFAEVPVVGVTRRRLEDIDIVAEINPPVEFGGRVEPLPPTKPTQPLTNMRPATEEELAAEKKREAARLDARRERLGGSTDETR